MVRLGLLITIATLLPTGGCSDDEPSEVDAAPGTDGSVGPDAAGASCGGIAGQQCADGLWCDYPDDDCGADDALGVCESEPSGCTEEYLPVCGCDGNVYGNECKAHAAGVDLSNLGGCEPPPQTFACGPRFCQQASEYCQVQISDTVGDPDTYQCMALPADCASTPDCACLSDEPCGSSCDIDADGNATLTCPGG